MFIIQFLEFSVLYYKLKAKDFQRGFPKTYFPQQPTLLPNIHQNSISSEKQAPQNT